MPFRSEKQRRFLWAKHPELAKRWAHDYPESNKNLPMYAKDTDKKPESDKPVSKAAALSSLRTALVNNCADVNKCSCLQTSESNSKTADSKLTHIKVPQDEKPTYAGERQIESILKPDTEDEGSIGQERTVNKQQNITNPLLSKLAVVLAPKIQQEIEDAKAREQARMAQRVPNNVNVKQYPVNTPTIPPPMGMAQAPQAPQAPQQPAQPQAQPQNGQLASVGGGSSPNANPINSFGGLSSNGDINGNAAFGTQNGMGGEKLATQKCSCGCGQTVQDCTCPVSCSCRQKGGSCYGKKTAAPKQASFDIAMMLKELESDDELNPEELTATLQPVKPQDPNMAALAAILGTSGTMEYLSGKNRRSKTMKFAAAGDPIQSWLMGMDHVEPETMLDILAEERMLKAAVEKWAYDIGNRRQSTNVVDRRTPEPSWMGKMLGYKAEPTDLSPSTAGLARANDSVLDKVLTNHHPSYSPNNRHTQAVARAAMDQQSRLSPTPSAVAVNNQIAVAENDYNEWKGRPPVNYDGRPADVRMRRPTGLPLSPREEKTPVPQSGVTAETQGAFKRYTPPQAPPSAPPQPNMLQKNSASTPAWQRAAGKNDEGGLNAKGRASYNRETGGNLKAPVTESNPSGERAKRQNSFCSRMCGMKRVNTGAKTKSDPDSRINKSLRKWNCKCGSAMEFGFKLAYDLGNRRQSTNVVDMTKNLQQPGTVGRWLGEKPSTDVLPRNFGEVEPFLDYSKKVLNDTSDYMFDGIFSPQRNTHTQAVDNFAQRLETVPPRSFGEQARSFATKYIPGAGRALNTVAPQTVPPTPANHPIANAVQDSVKKYQSPLPGKK